MGCAPASWPEWTFDWDDTERTGTLQFCADSAELPLTPAGRAVIDRERRHTTFHGAKHRSEAALLHPMLGTTAISVAAWRGDFALHAGVVVLDGGAWGFLGARGAGKSSALGWAVTHGLPVVADDLLITDGAVVRTGPRFIDLRAGAAEHFGIGTDVGVLGSRRRWRAPLPELAPEVPFHGWIELRWGSAVAVEPIPMEQRLPILAEHRAFGVPLDDVRSAMAVMARPALRFTRPQSWDAVDGAMTTLLDQISSRP